MRKIASLLMLIFVFASCSEDITRNNPALQGLKNDVSWRAAGITATKTANGRLTITGVRQFETLILNTNSTSPQTYVLGTNAQRSASFTTTNGLETVTYSTGVAGEGDGEIIITEYDDVLNTITGTFRFNAVNEADGATDVLNWRSGIFYKLPVVPAE